MYQPLNLEAAQNKSNKKAQKTTKHEALINKKKQYKIRRKRHKKQRKMWKIPPEKRNKKPITQRKQPKSIQSVSTKS
jgi:hypothetical protein